MKKSARGVQGFLLKSGGRHFFRVYESNDKRQFTDYRIDAEDVQIIVDDDKLLIKEAGEEPRLEWDDASLGIGQKGNHKRSKWKAIGLSFAFRATHGFVRVMPRRVTNGLIAALASIDVPIEYPTEDSDEH